MKHSTKDNPHNLYELTSIVAHGFRELFGEYDFWCTGEVSRCQIIKGKAYLDLIQTNTEGKVMAKSRAIILSPRVLMMFLQTTKIQSKDLVGMKILFGGRVNFHIEYGYSIIVNEISHSYTQGQIKKKETDLWSRLVAQKIANKNHQTSLGFPPLTIAVISSANSQGRGDVQSILNESGFRYDIAPYFCAIHGNDAASQVYDNLKAIRQDHNNGKKIDCVLIVRGGGGSSGILWQNDENIVKGVCHMPVPVYVAVGHSSDAYLLDKVAKVSCTTPTDAAYKILSHYHTISDQLDETYHMIYTHLLQALGHKRQTLDDLWGRITQDGQTRIKDLLHKIQEYKEIIDMHHPHRLAQRGYATIRDENKKTLTKEDVQSLQSGDRLFISLYDQEIEVQKV